MEIKVNHAEIRWGFATPERTGPVLMLGPCCGPLGVLAARLICGLHPVQVDPFLGQQLLGVSHGLPRQEARAAEDPGVVVVEDVEDAGAGVDDGQAGVVSGQNQVRAVGRNWEQKTEIFLKSNVYEMFSHENNAKPLNT